MTEQELAQIKEVVSGEVAPVKENLKVLSGKVDALIVDVNDLKTQVGGLWSKAEIIEDIHYRDQNEVREHLGLELLVRPTSD